jgi:AraC-like DNA-binding protein
MTDAPAIVRFSSADLAEEKRIAVWREQYGRMALRIDMEPAEDTFFEASLVTRALPGLQLLSAETSALRVTRSREFLADGNDDLVLVVNRTGPVIATARQRELMLGAGEAVLMSSSDVSAFERHARGGSLSLRLPRSSLASLVVDVEDAVMNLIPRQTEALRLLTSYAGVLLGESPLATPELRRTVVTHVHDLVAVALGATRDATDIAQIRGLRAARLRAAKAYIIENSRRRDLSIGTVAAHLGLTPRYLQRLFEEGGTTYSAFLLHQRLARAHRLLTQPRFPQSAVSTVAYDVGFGDLSYFIRCFKRHYGATPGDLRQEAGK